MRQKTHSPADLHLPVLLRETLEALAVCAGCRCLDGTLGLGGHAEAVLEAAECELLGLDRDQEALKLARTRLARFGKRVHFAHSRFSDFQRVLRACGWQNVDRVLLDIGVSSLQLDEGERGFSIRQDGPLDMRMDQSCGLSAADLVNEGDPLALRDIIARYGEEPNAERIVRAIVRERAVGRITSTAELANIIARSYPPSWRGKSRHHPARRTFQALRMAVNDEPGELERFLSAILPHLAPKGRLVVITFHSLEDRIVKKAMQRWASACICPPQVLVCSCGHRPEVRLLNKKPVVAGEEELQKNPRASSAKLRAVEKL